MALLLLAALPFLTAAWDIWRPGGHPFDLREEERVVQSEAERHAQCSFEALDANEPDFEKVWRSKFHKPLLIKNLVNKWTASQVWKPEWFKSFSRKVAEDPKHKNWEIRPWNLQAKEDQSGATSGAHAFSSTKLPLATEYFDMVSARDPATNAFKEPNAVIFDIDFECVGDKHLEPVAPFPKVLQPMCRTRHFAAAALATGHGLHRHDSAWQAQVIGNKSWYVMPPRVGEDYLWHRDSSNEHFGFPHEESIKLTNNMCGYKPMRKIYQDNLHFCVQGPGEVVYVPKHWWHSTCALDDFNLATGGTLRLVEFPWENDVVGRLPAKEGVPFGLALVPRQRPAERGVMKGNRGPTELYESVTRRLEPFGPYPGLDLLFEAIDGYCWDEQWMFNLGDVKGAIMEREVAEWVAARKARNQTGPVHGVEVGSFIGYSAMRIARSFPTSSTFVCVDPEYQKPHHAKVVNEILKLGMMEKVVSFLPKLSYEAIDLFAKENRQFDVISTDHIKDDYLPTLKGFIEKDLFRPNGLFIADNVIFFTEIAPLLQYLRTSKNFVDYKLYYTELEYDDKHGQPHPNGNAHPDGVVAARFVGQGKGKVYNSPDAATCAQYTDCAKCLVSFCGWCMGSQRCVPDIPGDTKACGKSGPELGTFAGDMRCPSSSLRPKEWVRSPSESGEHQQGRLRNNDEISLSNVHATKVTRPSIHFINKGGGNVEVFWVNEGKEFQQASLAPGGRTQTTSYAGHLFIARCAEKVPGLQEHKVSSDAQQSFVVTLACDGTDKASPQSAPAQPKVTFINNSPGGGTVEFFWKSPENKFITMQKVPGGQRSSTDSFEGHVFVAKCAEKDSDPNEENTHQVTAAANQDFEVSLAKCRKHNEL